MPSDERLFAAVDRALAERRYGEAGAALQPLMAGAAARPEVAVRLARLAGGQGKITEAVAYAQMAVTAKPGDPDLHQLAGELLRESGDIQGAITQFNAVLTARPNDPRALRASAMAARSLDMFATAEQLLRHGVAAAPRNAELRRSLGEIELWQGRIAAGLESLRRAVDLDPSEQNYDALLFHTLLSDRATDEELRGLIDAFATRHGGRLPGPTPSFENRIDPEKPLRVGFLSSGLRTNHNSLYFMAPILLQHDKAKMSVHLYGDVDYASAAQQPLLRLVAGARDTRHLSDGEVATAIRADGIDVLVSALGRGSEAPRTRVLRYRAAPIQMCFHHVMTSGYQDADYWIGDPVTVPEGTPEHFTERILRLPSLFAFAEVADHGPVQPLPALRNGFVTFASTTHAWKINPSVLECWRKLLRALPTARLRIKTLAFKDPAVMGEWQARLDDSGLAASRVELCAPQADFWQHMAFYNEADIVLDTFPYGCGNSALEALWMGVPLVTLAGHRFAGRQAMSMLAALGLSDLAAADAPAYVATAVRLAADLPKLAALRQSLRDRMRASPLFDHAGYCRAFDAAIRAAWREWCRAQAPSS